MLKEMRGSDPMSMWFWQRELSQPTRKPREIMKVHTADVTARGDTVRREVVTKVAVYEEK